MYSSALATRPELDDYCIGAELQSTCDTPEVDRRFTNLRAAPLVVVLSRNKNSVCPGEGWVYGVAVLGWGTVL